jgi:hypothetical protein
MPCLITTGLQIPNERSADDAVDRLSVTATQAVDLAATSGYFIKHKCPAWFSRNLKAYIKKNIDVTRNLRLFPQQIFL